MEVSNFTCLCHITIPTDDEESIFIHISECKEYQKYSPISEIFDNIPLKKLDAGQLIALKTEYNIYLRTIDENLIAKNFKTKFNPIEYRKNPAPKELKEVSLVKSYSNKQKPEIPSYYFNSLVKCEVCKKDFYDIDTDKFWYLQNCMNCVCRACLLKHINNNYIKSFGTLNCPVVGCLNSINEYDIVMVLGKEKFEKFNDEILNAQLNLVSCAKCKEKFEFIKGKADPNTKDEKGRKLTNEQAMNYVENRFTCLNSKCKTEQCRSCKATPYHLGFTCAEWSKNQQSLKCRYCDSVINKVDASVLKVFQSICKSAECQKKAKRACTKMHDCGHPCCGFLKEVHCLPCLEDSCAEKIGPELMDQKGSDYCNICFVEGLSNAPCIRVDCGHIFHYDCLAKRLELRWTRPRITFNFCLCPLCKRWMDFPVESELHMQMQANQVKFEDIKKKSLDRLKHEDRDKDERLKKHGDPYFEKPTEYAMAIYSYYECFKCKVPYFGGLKKCEDLLEEEKQSNEFKPSELVCANCCDIPIENCKKHGADFIEFKCKFCCTMAVWFCWGNTHFCEKCHQRATEVSRTPKKNLPKCPGIHGCPLKVAHRENGEECALGCSLCRNIKENYQKF